MPHDLNSPEHQTHADGFVEALADRSSTYHPDPAPSQANGRHVRTGRLSPQWRRVCDGYPPMDEQEARLESIRRADEMRAIDRANEAAEDIARRGFLNPNIRRAMNNTSADLAAERDAVAYGRGFLLVKADGTRHHVPPADVRLEPESPTEEEFIRMTLEDKLLYLFRRSTP